MIRFITLFIFLFGYWSLSFTQTVYSGMAAQYAAEGNYEKAIELEQEGLDVWERIHGKENLEYINSLHALARYLHLHGDTEKAVGIEYLAVEMKEKMDSIPEAVYADYLNALSCYLSEIGELDLALEFGKSALLLRESIFGKDHPAYNSSVNNVSLIYEKMGQFNLAFSLRKSTINLGNPEEKFKYATSLNNLAVHNSIIGNAMGAIELELEALSLIESIEGKNTENYKGYLMNLAAFKSQLGCYKEAIDIGNEVLSLSQNDNKDIFYSDILNNISSYYSKYGLYKEALQYANVALNIRKSKEGVRSKKYAASLITLAEIYSQLGNYDEAFNKSLLAKDILESSIKENMIECAQLYNNLANYYAETDNYKSAIEYQKQSLAIYNKEFSDMHPDYLMSLGNLSSYYAALGLYEDAININSEVLTSLYINSPLYPIFLLNQAYYYSFIKNYTKAVNLVERAMNSLDEQMDINHPLKVACLKALSDFYFYKDDKEKVEYYCSATLHILNKNIKTYFTYLSISERNKKWNKEKYWFEKIIPKYLYFYNDEIFIKISYNGILFSKNLLLNSEIEFDRFIGETGNKELLEEYNEIKSLRLQLNKLYEKPIAERYVDTDSLERRANELERQLMQESTEFGDYTCNLSITWEDVRDNLKEKDVAIEFVHFPLNNDSTMYMAYVLRPNMETPGLVKLFEEKDLKGLIDEDDKTSIYTNKSASELTWGKLGPQLEGVENVYFAPDGILHQIAIEYLPDIDGEGMISDRFNLHRLSSTREIVVNRHNTPSKQAVVYGGIKYDTDVTMMETESRKYDRTRTRGFSAYYNLGDALALRGSLEYLDGSLTEAENINGMMKENNYNSTFLSGNDATEESFKNLSGKSNGIIHISTHGFYWTESEAERKAGLNDRLMFMSQLGDNARRNVEDKALTRTGLFMAGAKNVLGGVELPEDVDDGILTAQEIANLNLRGLDLVVLSACQTGMGDISGDGVFGLQRGFKKAGANTILMSLWDVSDEATQILMTNFYKHYLGGMSKQQSLREAQKAVRETPGFSDPEYWASFILLDALN